MSISLSPWFVVALIPLALLEEEPPPRQKYGPWQIDKEQGYYFRKFEYKVNAADKEYRHEYVIYYKNDPKKQIDNNWVYFYNPKSEKYWARYPTTNHPKYGKDAKAGKEVWSVLAPQARQANLYAIDAKAWPAPPTDFCPPVPMSPDNANLLSPLSDLP